MKQGLKKLDLDTYSIFVGDVWEDFNRLLDELNPSKVFVLVDENTLEQCVPIFRKKIKTDCEYIVIPAGEQFKHLETCQHIWSELMHLGADRKSLMIDLGGGVIGDMGGFCASTFKRGFQFIQIPTTLLSQVDASVGGKLGIDFENVKNSIGVFNNPEGVFIYPTFLQTLSKEEVRSGFAEMIKHSLIADANQWNHFQKIDSLGKVNWLELLPPSLQIKQRIVEEDPFEKGIRKALNFGHTIGHAVETLFLESPTPLRHGEAIAIGIICEAYLSHQQVGLPKEELDEIVSFLLKIYPKVEIAEAHFPTLINWMRKDKKNENQEINFTYLTKIGKCVVNQISEPDAIMESMRFYNGLQIIVES